MCISQDRRSVSRIARWRSLFSRIPEEQWMDDGHVLFFSGVRQLTIDWHPSLSELLDCGLLELFIRVLHQIAGSWSQSQNWSKVRLLFVARFKEPDSLFAALDEPMFVRIVSEVISASVHDRSFLDRSFLGNDQNAFVPYHVLKSIGNISGSEKFVKKVSVEVKAALIEAVRPYLFGAMTTLEVVEAARVVANCAATTEPALLDKIYSDRSLLDRMVRVMFDGPVWIYRDIWRFFWNGSMREYQPHYFHDALNPYGNRQEQFETLNELCVQVQTSGIVFFSQSVTPKHVAALLETKFFSRLIQSRVTITGASFDDALPFIFEEFVKAGRLCDLWLQTPGMFEMMIDSIESLHGRQRLYAALGLEFIKCCALTAENLGLLERVYQALLFCLEFSDQEWNHDEKRFHEGTPLETLVAFEKANPTLGHKTATLRQQKDESDRRSVLSGHCLSCSKAPLKLMICSGCKLAQFCSRECQKTAWPQHRKTCSPAALEKALLQNFSIGKVESLSAPELDQAITECPIRCRKLRCSLFLARFRLAARAIPCERMIGIRCFNSARVLLGGPETQLGPSDLELAVDTLFQGRLYAQILICRLKEFRKCSDKLIELGVETWLNNAAKEFGNWMDDEDDEDDDDDDEDDDEDDDDDDDDVCEVRAIKHRYFGVTNEDLGI